MWRHRNLSRPYGKHIGNEELNAIVPSSSKREGEQPRLSLDQIREAERHVRSCVDCSSIVSTYRLVVSGLSNDVGLQVPPGPDCPREVNWYRVATGMLPESEASQWIMHAAPCDHCGPRLRAATRTAEVAPQAAILSEPKIAAQPNQKSTGTWHPPAWQFAKWLVPVTAFLLIIGAFVTMR